MRLTVGPLPSAVYWRRRAVVLGALLLVVVVLYASCSGSGSDADSKGTAGSRSTPSTVDDPGAGPTETVLTPETGPAPDGGQEEDPGEADPTGAAPAPQAPAGGTPCSDDEIAVTPVPAKSTVARNNPIDLRLIIKSSSDRACARDVGADLQELRIVKGAETIWSSDHCGASKGSDVQTLNPGVKYEYGITWNGRSSTKCSAGAPAGPAPPAGQYQLLARLGTKHSSPVALTITA